jgi:general secretion pathway protein L
MARILGIDIDRTFVRGALLKTAFRRVEVERYVKVPLTQSAESLGRATELHDAFASLVRALGRPPDTVVSAIDGELASLRVVELPMAAAKRAAEVLPFELESLLPFEVGDAVIDYQPIETHEGQLRLLAAAVLRERVREHIALFQGGPFEPREIAVGAVALDGLRTLCPELTTGRRMLIELCERETNVCALNHGRASFGRTLSVGADGLPHRTVELTQGLRQTLAAYRAAGGVQPDVLHLVGKGDLDGFSAHLAQELGLPVDLLTLPGPEDSGTEGPLEFARAAALAGRVMASGKRINLRTGEFVATRAKSDLMSSFNLIAMCALVVLVTAVFSLKVKQSVLSSEQAALRKQLRETTQRVFGKAETDPAKVMTMITSPTADNPLPRFDAYDALAAISASVPSDITHEMRHMRIDLAEEKKEGQVELQGSLGSIEQRDLIVAQLEAHGCFKEIQRGRTSPGRTADTLNYQLEAKLMCPGDTTGAKKKKTTTRSSDGDE